MVITSHDPLRWNFSDSTSLSEVLIIATRRRNGKAANGRSAKFVSLWRNPDGIIDAHLMASAISATKPVEFDAAASAVIWVSGQPVGEMIAMPESFSKTNRWLAVQFARQDVLRPALRLLNNGVVSLPGVRTSLAAQTQVALCRLDDLGEIGPDRRDLWDGFDSVNSVTTYPMVENHDTEYRRGLVAEINNYLMPLREPRPGRRLKEPAELLKKSGRLLVAERLWLNTTRMIAMRANERVLSNVWWPVNTRDGEWDKALTVWLNSSLGIMTLLSVRTSTRGGWVALKKADLAALAVLDMRAMPAEQLQALSALFDELAEMEFMRLQEMADCPARRALDDGLSRILGLPDMSALRRMLATEPVVSNRRL